MAFESRLVLVIDSRTGEQSLQRLDRSLEGVDRRGEQASRQMGTLNRDLTSLSRTARTAGAALGAAFSVRAIVNQADTWTNLTSRVELSIGAHEDAADVMSRLADISRQTFSTFESTAQAFAQNSVTLRALGKTTQEQLNYTEALNNAMAVSGAEGANAELVQNALSRAMAEGAVKGDDLNLVLNYGSRIAELLAEELGVNVTQLRGLAAQGEITGDVIYTALTSNMELLAEESAGMGSTVRGAMRVMSNSILESVGVLNQQYEAGARVSRGILSMSDAIRETDWAPYVSGLSAIAALYAGRLAGSIGQVTARKYRNIEATIASMHQAALEEAQEQGRIATIARRQSAESTAAANRANIAAQGAAIERQEAAQDVARLKRMQTQLAAERTLASERLHAQTTAAGRMQLQARIAQLQATETTTTNQLAAANVRLTQAEVAEASAKRAATLAASQKAAADTAATAAMDRYTASSRAATAANTALAVAGRAASAALSMVGGPLGAAVIAGGALAYFATRASDAERESDELAARLSELEGSFDGMSRAAASAALDDAIRQQELMTAAADESLISIRDLTLEYRRTGVSMRDGISAWEDMRDAISMGEDVGVATDAFLAALNPTEKLAAEVRQLALEYEKNTDKSRSAADQAERLQRFLDKLAGAAESAGDSINNNAPSDKTIKAWGDLNAKLAEQMAILRDPSEMGAVVRELDSIDGLPAWMRGWTVFQQAQIDAEAARQKAVEERQEAEERAAADAQQSAQQILRSYESQVASLSQQIALFGETSELAKTRYALEHGTLKSLLPDQKRHIEQLAEELELKRLQVKEEEKIDQLRRNYIESSSLSDLFSQRQLAEGISGPAGDLAATSIEGAINSQAMGGRPNVGGLDPMYSGALGELQRIQQEREALEAWYDERITMYQRYRQLEVENAAHYDAVIRQLEEQRATDVAQIQHQEQVARIQGYADMFGSLASLSATFAGDSAGITKGLIAFQQAANLATTISNMAAAQSQAGASMPFPANLAAMATVAAQGAALISTIGSIVSPPEPSFSASSYSISGQAHDGWDNLPKTGTYNLEKGERVVSSALNRDLTRYLERAERSETNGGSITIHAPVTVQAQPGMSNQDAQRQGSMMGKALRAEVLKIMQDQQRPGGVLAKR